MNFKEWFCLTESSSISDFLKSIDRDVVKLYKSTIKPILANVINLSVDSLTNLFVKIYIEENLQPNLIQSQFNRDWQEFGAVITAKINQDKNYFNKNLTREDLKNLNVQYHRDLSLKGNTRKGPQGEVVADVFSILNKYKEQLPEEYAPDHWQGWKWVSLGCLFSDEEAAAAGHCGNVGGSSGDNIISLRDNKNHVFLTFIVNTYTGMLGEAKAINNQKPTKEFHPAIVSLLLSGYVKNYQGGGYLEENNFNLDDIKNKQVRQLLDSHFENIQHKIPSNYYPSEWLSQWDQQVVDNLNLQEKINLLINVVRVVKNHQLFSTQLNPETKVWEHKQIPNLKFNLSKLIVETIPKINDIKKLIETIKQIGYIKNNNNNDNQVNSTYEITDEAETLIANKLLASAKKGNVREKISIASELDSLGYKQGMVTKPGSKFPVYPEWNIYQKEINSINDSIADEIIQKKHIPDVASEPFYSNYIEGFVSGSHLHFDQDSALTSLRNQSLKEFQWVGLSKDKKRAVSNFFFYFHFENKSRIVETVFATSINKYNLKGKGYSPWMDTIRSYSDIPKKITTSVIINILEKRIAEKVNQIIERNGQKDFKINKTDDGKFSNHVDITIYNDPISLLKEIKTTRTCKRWEEVLALINKLVNTISEEFFEPNNLEKFISNNADEIIKQSKKYGNKYSPVKRHSKKQFEQFEEFLRRRMI